MTFSTDGSVTSPIGFTASGIACGLKKSGTPDLAMIFSQTPAVAAGAFTSNLFAAAPVVRDRGLMERGVAVQAVVINSGNANACTGIQGMKDADAMAEQAATLLGISPDSVMISSTGRIGVPMPMATISKGIQLAAKSLSASGGKDAARAIITTDTHEKHASATVEIGGKTVTIGAMTKGAGMIAPQMKTAGVLHATMLAYFTTDAAISQDALRKCLDQAIFASFNRIIIDGDTSTNDTVIALANGMAGNEVIEADSPQWHDFLDAFRSVAEYLAKEMVMDGEGATKFVELDISGLADDAEARQVAEAIARSPLCKTAWFGCDPNWGRILDAAGYSHVPFNPEEADLDYDELPIVRGGMAAASTEQEQVKVMKKRSFTIHLRLGRGPGKFVLWTSDISHDYVTINADYHT